MQAKKISISIANTEIRLNHSLIDKIGEQLVFALLLFNTLGVVLPRPLASMVSLLAYPAALLLLLHRWKKILYVLTRDPSYLLLIILAVASLTWSASPSMTLKVVRSLLSTSILVAYISASYSPKDQMRLWSRVLLIWGLLSVLVEVLFPSYTQFALGIGSTSFWKGVFTFKLGLGISMALGGVLAIYAILNTNGKKIWLPIVFLMSAFALIILSESKTSLLAFVVIVLLFPIYLISQQKNYKLRTVKYLLAFLLSMMLICLVIVNFETIVVDLLGKDLTLTGRSSLWTAILTEGIKKPWLGYGHGAFWFTENSLNAAFLNDWPALPPTGEYFKSFHSHSGYIELFLNLGFIGVALFAINYVLVCKRVLFLFFVLKREEFFWMLQIIVFMTIINFSEVGSFLIARNLLWVLYSTAVLSSAIEHERYQFRIKHQATLLSPKN